MLPLLDLDRARAFAAGEGAGPSMLTRASMAHAILLDAWLDHYKIQLAA